MKFLITLVLSAFCNFTGCFLTLLSLAFVQRKVLLLEDDELCEPFDVHVLFVLFAALHRPASPACLVGDWRRELDLVQHFSPLGLAKRLQLRNDLAIAEHLFLADFQLAGVDR